MQTRRLAALFEGFKSFLSESSGELWSYIVAQK